MTKQPLTITSTRGVVPRAVRQVPPRPPAAPVQKVNLPVREPPQPVLLDRFWFVWAPDCTRPRKRHGSLEAAKGEARRLREAMPRRKFYVYEARREGFSPA